MNLAHNRGLHYGLIVFLFLSVITISCTHKVRLPVLEINDDFKGKIDLGKIQLVGPFLYDSTKTSEINSLDVNDLNNFGLKEDSLNEQDFLNIKVESAKDKRFLHPEFRNTLYTIPADNIDFLHLVDTTATARRESNFYLACNIESNKEQEVVFLASTCFGLKVWLNNHLVLQESGKFSFPKGYDYYITLRLKEGNNFVLLKVNRGINKLCWRLVSKIADTQTAKEEFRINCFTDYIVNPIVKNNENLRVHVGGYLKGKSISIDIVDKLKQNKIYDHIDTVVDSTGFCQINVSNLIDDFYSCRLVLSGDTLNEKFYHGDIDKLYELFTSEIKALNTGNKSDLASLNGAMKRFGYLMHKKYRLKSTSEVKFNNKNVVISAFAIRNILENEKTSKNRLFENAKGTFLKAYKSKIDGTYQYYMFHVSEKVLAQNKIPLVAIMPFFHNPLDSMLTSWYLSNTDQIEWEKRLADENGFALFWPYLRGNSASSPISNADFFEAFEDVKRNYVIDPDRVFLMGDCAGATRSLLLASRYPTLFAGISLFQPLTSAEDETNSPMNFVGNLSNIPIYIYHSTKDEVIPIKNSDDFMTEAATYGYIPHYDRSEKDSHYLLPKNCHYPIFQFFKNISITQTPDTINFTTYEQKYNKAYWINLDQFSNIGKTVVKAQCYAKENTIKVNAVNVSAYSIVTTGLRLDKSQQINVYTNGILSYQGKITDTISIHLNDKINSITSKNSRVEGPIRNFFADEFVYVEPNVGTTISKMITKNWGKEIFFKLNTINENSFNQFCKNSNIILFNNQYSNPQIKELISKLPIKYDSTKLIFRDTEIDGSKLSYCFIYPNPLNPNKYILYIGTNQTESFKLIESNQLINGCYDYLIWNNKFANSQIVEGGYFDLNWK